MKAHLTAGLLALAVMSIATFPACWTYSLHPIAEDNDPHLIYDPALEGTWKSSGGQNEPLIIITGDSKLLTYSLLLVKFSETGRQDDAPDVRFDGKMVQLGSNRFFDALPQGDAQGLGSLPAHNILKVTLTHDSLALVLPSDDWLCKETRMKLGECINQGFLLTAPTDILQSFLQKHGSDNDLFPKPSDGDFMHRVQESQSEK
ncbi:MAG: hypothetical protein JWN74_59 [Acidobacteriaceae bacterium]|jgi:hypothetical protein|nr:hypothetical protein [Acidobacteriaceae bacterium]